jgi:hypothetical protein
MDELPAGVFEPLKCFYRIWGFPRDSSAKGNLLGTYFIHGLVLASDGVSLRDDKQVKWQRAPQVRRGRPTAMPAENRSSGVEVNVRTPHLMEREGVSEWRWVMPHTKLANTSSGLALADRVAAVTSEKQIAANRRNATRSTGPVTAEGKARASRNALRHGFSRPVSPASSVATGIEEFARQLVGDTVSPTELNLASEVAEAQSDLSRIYRERQRLLEVMVAGVWDRQTEAAQDPQAIGRLDRYERRAESRRNKALGRMSKLRRLPIFK